MVSEVEVSEAIHKNDDMWQKTATGMKEYPAVGRHGIVCIDAALKDKSKVKSVLDFGCGHGRVARHLAAEFPDARRSFADIDKEAWQFCKKEFGHSGFTSPENLKKLKMPEKYDLIWSGSVFTHLTWERCEILLDKMLDALNPGGTIVATFRGHTLYERMRAEPERHNINGWYEQLLVDYEQTEFGYMDYKHTPGWGQNLFSHAKVAELSNRKDIARHEMLEILWAGSQDVAVWERA